MTTKSIDLPEADQPRFNVRLHCKTILFPLDFELWDSLDTVIALSLSVVFSKRESSALQSGNWMLLKGDNKAIRTLPELHKCPWGTELIVIPKKEVYTDWD
jgi:hypothetical protein